jgi:hypothetical protein
LKFVNQVVLAEIKSCGDVLNHLLQFSLFATAGIPASCKLLREGWERIVSDGVTIEDLPTTLRGGLQPAAVAPEAGEAVLAIFRAVASCRILQVINGCVSVAQRRRGAAAHALLDNAWIRPLPMGRRDPKWPTA